MNFATAFAWTLDIHYESQALGCGDLRGADHIGGGLGSHARRLRGSHCARCNGRNGRNGRRVGTGPEPRDTHAGRGREHAARCRCAAYR
jgi:hypothetical protein